jgi:hypothetical protein
MTDPFWKHSVPNVNCSDGRNNFRRLPIGMHSLGRSLQAEMEDISLCAPMKSSPGSVEMEKTRGCRPKLSARTPSCDSGTLFRVRFNVSSRFAGLSRNFLTLAEPRTGFAPPPGFFEDQGTATAPAILISSPAPSTSGRLIKAVAADHKTGTWWKLESRASPEISPAALIFSARGSRAARVLAFTGSR